MVRLFFSSMVYVNIFLVAAYVIPTIILCGIPDSISAMVYNLSRKWRWLWTVWMYAVALTLAPCLIDLLPDDVQFIGFLTIAFLGFVGAMPLCETDMRMWHYMLAVAAGIFSQVCVAVINPYMLLSWALVLPFLRSDKNVFASEVICWLTMVGTIILGKGYF